MNADLEGVSPEIRDDAYFDDRALEEFDARLLKETTCPLAPIEAWRLALSPSAAPEETLARTQLPVWRSCRNTSGMAFQSAATRLVASLW